MRADCSGSGILHIFSVSGVTLVFRVSLTSLDLGQVDPRIGTIASIPVRVIVTAIGPKLGDTDWFDVDLSNQGLSIADSDRSTFRFGSVTVFEVPSVQQIERLSITPSQVSTKHPWDWAVFSRSTSIVDITIVN